METKLPTNLPAIIDLYKDESMVKLDDLSKFNALLNKPPKPSWVKDHPTAKDSNNEPIKYIPIERVEYLMTRIFFNWRVEIKSVFQLANSVVVTVRVHYFHPVTGQDEWQDGVGAAPLQTAKGAGAIDWSQIKNASVQIGAPAAESYAFKDACEKLGKLFGKDMNRKDTMNYDNIANTFEPMKEQLKKEVEDLMQDCQDDEFRTEIVEAIMDAEEGHKDTLEFYQGLLKKITKK